MRSSLLPPPRLLAAMLLCAPLACLADGPIRVVLAGQALMRYDARVSAPQSFQDVRQLLAGSDVAFTNLEAAVRGPGSGLPTRGDDLLHAVGPDVLDSLQAEGFNVLALGNNHSWDLGTSGVAATLQATDSRHIAHAGLGLTLAQAEAPARLDTAHGLVLLVAVASGKVGAQGAATAGRPGVNELRLDEATKTLNEADRSRILATIRKAAAEGLVIVYDHNHYWEASMADTPPWIERWARDCIDAGAAMFVSHGEPLMHGIEIYHGRPIFYNLGNLVFQTKTQEKWKGPEIWQSVVADCTFTDGKFVSATLIPLVLNEKGEAGPRFIETRGWPRRATGQEAASILQSVQTLSRRYGTALEITGDIARIGPAR